MEFQNYVEPEESEREYQELKRLGLKLHIPVPECFLGIKLYDGQGRVIRDDQQRSHTWNRNYYNSVWVQAGLGCGNGAAFGAGGMGLKNTSGSAVGSGGYYWTLGGGSTSGTYLYTGDGFCANATAGTAAGIVVGSSDAAESFDHYALQTAISHGTGAGNLYYHQTNLPIQSYDSGTKTWQTTFIRYFSNQSGGNVQVKETAFYYYMYYYNGSAAKAAMMLNRDKLASTITVPNLGQIGVIYTVSMTFPE